jgi:transposase
VPHEILSTIQPLRTSPSGGVTRPRVAIFCPARFVADRPFLVVLFFHGFESLCANGHRRPFEDSLRRHGLARQLAASNRNAIIVAPRIALSAREHRRGLPFQTRRSVDALMREAGSITRRLLGAPAGFSTAFMEAPLLLVGFSGGHHALSALTAHPDLMVRTKAIAFFDALYDDDRYARDPAPMLQRTALICINRRHYDRDNGPKEANYRKRLSGAGVKPKRLAAVESIAPGTAIIERIAEPDHCTMLSACDGLARVMAKIEGPTGFRLLKPRAAAG